MKPQLPSSEKVLFLLEKKKMTISSFSTFLLQDNHKIKRMVSWKRTKKRQELSSQDLAFLISRYTKNNDQGCPLPSSSPLLPSPSLLPKNSIYTTIQFVASVWGGSVSLWEHFHKSLQGSTFSEERDGTKHTGSCPRRSFNVN